MAKKKEIEVKQNILFGDYTPKPVEVEEDKKKNPLYEIINAIFGNSDYIKDLTYESARQNIFMVMRIMGIGFPDKINYFNVPKINPYDILRYLSLSLYTGGKPPQWIYTSAKKAASENKTIPFTEAEIKEYIKYADITRKDFADMMRFMPEQTTDQVTEYIQYMKKLKSNKDE